MSTSPTLGRRLGNLFRNRRLRTVVLLLGGYKAYTTYQTYSILNKPFSADRHRPGQTILDLDLDAVQIITRETYTPFSSVEEIRLQRLISALEEAKHDPRVAGLVVRGLGGLRGIGLAEVAELRDIIKDFSTGWGGKQTMLHVPEGLGASGNGTVPMYFASAFNSVHVQPTSGIIIPGLSAAALFFKKMLDNVGIKAKKVARKEFKTAVNGLTEEKFTDPHRESTEALLKAIMDAIVKGTAEGRDIEEKKVQGAIDTAIMSPEEAKEYGIVDEALYRDELPKAMRERIKIAEESRNEKRKETETEWMDAMTELKRVWVEGGSNEIWAGGDILRYLSSFETATAAALSFANTREVWKKEAIDAEIRALKAHLQWLDTCPWEEVQETEEEALSVYHRITNISSILETERRLCVDAVKALTECPPLLESMRKEAEDEVVLEVNEKKSMSLIRNSRSMWRAKCLVARMVGTMVGADDTLRNALKSEEQLSEATLDQNPFQPIIFLAGVMDDLRVRTIVEDGKNGEITEKPSDGDILSSEKPDINVVKSGMQGEKARYLKHVRFSDYIDLVTSEKRAAIDRSRGFIRLESKDPYQSLPGAVDYAERQALLRLQLAGYPFAPWRISLPKSGIVAIIAINGPISDETADITRAALRRADKDPQIKAVVLRIDSPGGSATASDLISRAVEVAKKPVVASMGSVCASGGYFISAPCDKVFASDMTITGSIGVIFSAFNTAGLFDKIGITSDSVESARFSKYFGAQGAVTEWSDEFANRINKLIDNFYKDFVNVVAKGRRMGFEQAEKIARGRVWAGSDALALGLVDEIGGLREAVGAAAELASLPPDGRITAINYPTVAMLLQDAARRNGLIPSNLDEEGDESVTDRRRRWFFSRSTEHDQKDEPDVYNASEPVSAAVASQLFGRYERWYHFAIYGLLTSLDRFLLSSSSPMTSEVVEMLLGRVTNALQRNQSASIISDELERTQAIAGRPAAIAPHIRLDD